MAAQENRILTRFLDNFTELYVRMRGFGIYTMPRMCSTTQKDANFRFTHRGAQIIQTHTQQFTLINVTSEASAN